MAKTRCRGSASVRRMSRKRLRNADTQNYKWVPLSGLPAEVPVAPCRNSGSELWGLSSAGRAPDLHSGGQRFDPARLHQIHDLTVKRVHAFCRPIGRKLTSFRENTIQHCLIPLSKAAISVRFHLGGRHTDECFLAYLSCIPAETNRVVQVKYTNQSSCRPTSAGAG